MSAKPTLPTRTFKVGDCVEIAVAICEVAGWTGTIIQIDRDNSMPYLVRLHRNLREWPFAAEELRHVYHETDEEADRCCA